MQVRDRIIREVALELGISQKKVREIIMAQAILIRKTLKSKQKVSIYLRKVGMFMHNDVRSELIREKIERTEKKITTKGPQQDPFKFE